MLLYTTIQKSYALYLVNNFAVASRFLKFDHTIHFTDPDNNIKEKTCTGKIFYPYISHDDEYIFIKINNSILNFAKTYKLCNEGDYSHYSVRYDTPATESLDFFSVRWITEKHDKILRIDTLNFDMDNGDLLTRNEIFNLLAPQMLNKLIELSEGYLDTNISWNEFLDKIDNRDVQLYIKDTNWYIIFNKTDKSNDMVEKKMPDYFFKNVKVT